MKGSCLCGAVAYEVERLEGPVFHCHCHTCQKAHSAPFAATARAPRAGFRWLAGDGSRGAFESSPGKLRHFCRDCGAHLMAEWLGRDSVIIRVASLDEDPGVRSALHIWRAHDRPWLAYEGFPEHAEWPPSAQ